MSMNSVFKCEGDNHYLLRDMVCYSSSHITLMIISAIGQTFFLSINLIIALLYNETQPVKENALSRLESNFEWIMLAYRYCMSLLQLFCFQNFCFWIIVLISLVSSGYFLYQYFKFLPYYNSTVSQVFGSMLGIYCWISVNALLTGLYDVSGSIVVILVGSPFVVWMIKYLRNMRRDWLMYTPIDSFATDIDCLNQIMTFQEWIHESQKNYGSQDTEIRIKGFINQHMLECESLECVCARIGELYDNQTDSYLQLADLGLVYEPEDDAQHTGIDEEENQYASLRSQQSVKRRQPVRVQQQEEENQQKGELHKNEVFIVNFNRQLYKDALNKFDKSVFIHILFAYFYYHVLNNIHAALHELKIASKKRPNIYQQFTIYRYQNMIELSVKNESKKKADAYEQLTNVKEFERLYQEMGQQIEKVCNYQLEFWAHLANVIPDLNFLSKLNNSIVDSAAEADRYWELLCKINPNYPQALLMYAEYQTTIRNNQKQGKLFSDKAEKIQFGAKGAGANENVLTSSEVLFSDEAVIIHISGNKETSGKVMKTSHGLRKCFGYDRAEVNSQNVTILMTNMFAQKHNLYLEQYYQTARKMMFNKERTLFAAHKTGYCFQVHVLIKQMPSLTEGIQYVGMVKPLNSDNDFILTDMNGYIDSFTSGIGQLFNINPQLVKDNSNFNIQFIAPELVEFFDGRLNQQMDKDDNHSINSSVYQSAKSFGPSTKQKSFHHNVKYSLPGGETITFYIPNNFMYILKQENSVRAGRGQKGNRYADSHVSPSHKSGSPEAGKQSPIFKEFIKYVQKGTKGLSQKREFGHLRQLLQCKEYKDYDQKKKLQVEVRELIIPLGNSEEKGIRMLQFKIPKNQIEIKSQDVASFEDADLGAKRGSTQNERRFENAKSGAIQHNAGELKMMNTQNMKNVHKTRTMKAAIAVPDMSLDQVQRNLSFTNNRSTAKNDGVSDADKTLAKNETLKANTPYSDQQMTQLDIKTESLKESSQQTVAKIQKPNLDIDLSKLKQEGQENDIDEKDTVRIDVKLELQLQENKPSKLAEETKADVIPSVQRRFAEDQQLHSPSDFARSHNNYPNPTHVKPSTPLYLVQSQVKDLDSVPRIDTEGIAKSNDYDDLEEMDEWEDDEYGEDEFYLDEEYEEESEGSAEDQLNSSPRQAGTPSNKSNKSFGKPEGLQPKRQKSRVSQKSRGAQGKGGHTRSSNLKKSGAHHSRNQRLSASQIMLNLPKDQINQTSLGPKVKKHDYSKIVTNKKYVCFDEDKETCGSYYLNEWNANGSDIDKDTMNNRNQLDSMIIRETIKKASKTTVLTRKPTKRKTQKQQTKTDKAKGDENNLNRHTSNRNDMDGLLNGHDETPGASQEEEIEEQEEPIHEFEETEAMINSSPSKHKKKHHAADEDKNNQGEASSVSSTLTSQNRTYYSLKQAIDEKFVPLQIRNLRLVANGVWITVFLLSIVFFIIQSTLFSQIKSFVQIISQSEQRIEEIMHMNLRMTDISLINEGYLNVNSTGFEWNPALNTTLYQQVINSYTAEFMQSATALSKAQTEISITTASYDDAAFQNINPESITLQYFDSTALPSNYTFNIWEAVLQISIQSYSLAETPTNITHQRGKFIAINSMNSLLEGLLKSTQALVNQSDQARVANNQVFLILVLSVSGALGLSMVFLLPVIRKAKDNKQEVFILLTHKKIEKLVDEQLKRCRMFINKYQNDGGDDAEETAHETQVQGFNPIEENAHMPGEKKSQQGQSSEEKKDDYIENVKKQKRKWRAMNNNFFSLSVKFLTVLLLIESFFVFTYITSSNFLLEVSQLMLEMRTLISRYPLMEFSLLLQKELIYSNSTSTFLFQPVYDISINQLKTQNSDYQNYIQLFQENYGVHTSQYNSLFHEIMFEDVCNSTVTDTLGLDKDQCQDLNRGILMKGVYAAVVKFWQDLQSQISDFFGQQRTLQSKKQLLNSPMLEEEQLMMQNFVSKYHQYLSKMVQDDIDTAFINESQTMNIVFAIFVIYVVFIYLVVWRAFMKSLLEELWRAKACLTLLPIEICFRIEEIRSFIYRNSSGFS